MTWLTAFCNGLAAALKSGGTLIILAPSPMANYWTEELDKLLTNKATGAHALILEMVHKWWCNTNLKVLLLI